MYPTEPCNRKYETLYIQGGLLSRALLLPASRTFCRDKSIGERRGGLQTTFDLSKTFIELWV